MASDRFGWPGDGYAQDVYRCAASGENAPEWGAQICPRVDDLDFKATLYALEEVIDPGLTRMLPAACPDPGGRGDRNPGRLQLGVLATLNEVRQNGHATLLHEPVDQVKGLAVEKHRAFHTSMSP